MARAKHFLEKLPGIENWRTVEDDVDTVAAGEPLGQGKELEQEFIQALLAGGTSRNKRNRAVYDYLLKSRLAGRRPLLLSSPEFEEKLNPVTTSQDPVSDLKDKVTKVKQGQSLGQSPQAKAEEEFVNLLVDDGGTDTGHHPVTKEGAQLQYLTLLLTSLGTDDGYDQDDVGDATASGGQPAQ